MSVCVKCGKNLTYNEIGAYRKFVNRGGKDFLCKECLAKRLGLSRASLYRAFEALETAGLIRREGKTVFVLDRGGLAGVL